MRLFYALTFNENTILHLIQIQNQLEPLLSKGRRSTRGNLHLTLSFLGEQEPSLVPILSNLLSQLPKQSISLNFTHLGRFNKPEGSIIYLASVPNQRLNQLQALLVNELQTNTIKLQDTRFQAHVTLFRSARIESLPTIESLECTCRTVSLLHSHQVDGVLTYTPLASKFLSEK